MSTWQILKPIANESLREVLATCASTPTPRLSLINATPLLLPCVCLSSYLSGWLLSVAISVCVNYTPVYLRAELTSLPSILLLTHSPVFATTHFLPLAPISRLPTHSLPYRPTCLYTPPSYSPPISTCLPTYPFPHLSTCLPTQACTQLQLPTYPSI